MKRLILMRHAKSDWSGGQDDHDRPLNTRGQLSADALGVWLRQRGLVPDQILCSSATRTCETLARLGLDVEPTMITGELYLASQNQILDVLRRAVGNVVLMLGHNPGIGAAAAALANAQPNHPKFMQYPTGATLVLDFDTHNWGDVQWGTGQPEAFALPRELLAD